MTLDDWLTLTTDERQSLPSRWRAEGKKTGDEWFALATEVEARFKADFGNLQEIAYVAHAVTEDLPFWISVATKLSTGQRIAALPDEYLTFAVEQDPIGDLIQVFKDDWRVLLKNLFGWSEEVIQKFIASREWVWGDAWFGHDPPDYFLPWAEFAWSRLKACIDLQARPDLQFEAIGRKLMLAFENCPGYRDGFKLFQNPDFDWKLARQEIENVLSEYQSKSR